MRPTTQKGALNAIETNGFDSRRRYKSKNLKHFTEM
jgi:hypothetical protein